MKPGRQRLLIPGLLVALLIVVAIVSGIRRADAAETPVPEVPVAAHTQVSTLTDSRITESSGLAASIEHPGLAYTINDSGDESRVFAVDVASGRVVGVTTVSNARWRDSEALALRDGRLWVADAGNNRFNRTDQALYVFGEPGAGNHEVRATRYPLDFTHLFNGTPIDVEALTVLPGSVVLYVKTFPVGLAVSLPLDTLRTDQPNAPMYDHRDAPPFTTDATVSTDDRFVLLRNAAMVETRDVATWKVMHRDAIPVMDAGETITMEPRGTSYLIGSEGADSPLVRVAFDPSKWTSSTPPTIDLMVQARAQHPVKVFVWKHRYVLAGVTALAALGTLGWVVSRRRARRSLQDRTRRGR